jgi:hypothetical protein
MSKSIVTGLPKIPTPTYLAEGFAAERHAAAPAALPEHSITTSKLRGTGGSVSVDAPKLSAIFRQTSDDNTSSLCEGHLRSQQAHGAGPGDEHVVTDVHDGGVEEAATDACQWLTKGGRMVRNVFGYLVKV